MELIITCRYAGKPGLDNWLNKGGRISECFVRNKKKINGCQHEGCLLRGIPI